MKYTWKAIMASALILVLLGTFAACKRDTPADATTPSQTGSSKAWDEETAATVMGTDASGVTQVYEVVTDAQGKDVTQANGEKVTKPYVPPVKPGSTTAKAPGTTSAGKTTTKPTTKPGKPTTTKPNENNDPPEPENPGWGPGHDASEDPFVLKDGYDSELFDWVNSGIGALNNRGDSSHMYSPKSTLSDWTYDAVRSYANTGSMNWSGIMDHVEKNKELFPNGILRYKASTRVAVSGFKGKTYAEAGKYIAQQIGKDATLKKNLERWGGAGEDFLGVYQKGGYWYVVAGCAASRAWR